MARKPPCSTEYSCDTKCPNLNWGLWSCCTTESVQQQTENIFFARARYLSADLRSWVLLADQRRIEPRLSTETENRSCVGNHLSGLSSFQKLFSCIVEAVRMLVCFWFWCLVFCLFCLMVTSWRPTGLHSGPLPVHSWGPSISRRPCACAN